MQRRGPEGERRPYAISSHLRSRRGDTDVWRGRPDHWSALDQARPYPRISALLREVLQRRRADIEPRATPISPVQARPYRGQVNAECFFGRTIQSQSQVPALTRAYPSGAALPGYELVGNLKKGGMSMSVDLVKKNGKIFVEKRIAIPNKTANFEAANEVRALKCASHRSTPHPNINGFVTCLWKRTENPSLTLILEWCDMGTLNDLLVERRLNRVRFEEKFLWHCMKDIANGLAFLHQGIGNAIEGDSNPRQGWDQILHLDVKPANIFLTSNGARHGELPRVVIGDFGCAVFSSDFEEGRVRRNVLLGGTTTWDAPETDRYYYTPACDVWQLAAIIKCCARLVSVPALAIGNGSRAMPCGKEYSASLNRMVRGLMDLDPARRLKAANVAKEAHKVLTRGDW